LRGTRGTPVGGGSGEQTGSIRAGVPPHRCPTESEAGWMAVVIDLARWRRWRIYHTFDSRRSASGFPDLVMVRNGRLVIAELKRDAMTERARARQLTDDQRAWLTALSNVDNVEVYLWRPVDWPTVKDTLW